MPPGSSALGFGVGLSSAILFGLYMVPRQRSSLADHHFLVTLAAGAMLGTALGFAVAGGGIGASRTDIGLAWIAGALWSAGTFCYIASVSRMGLAIATPAKNTTAVLGTGVGLVVFGEARETAPLPALVGSALVVLCAVLLASAGERAGRRSRATLPGLLLALAAALLYAVYTIPFKLALGHGLSLWALLLFMGQGAFVAAFLGALLRDRGLRFPAPPRAALGGLLGGLIWAGAVFLMGWGIELVGLAVTWPLSNLNTVVTVACGVWIFREIDPRRQRAKLLGGLALAVAGAALLGIAR